MIPMNNFSSFRRPFIIFIAGLVILLLLAIQCFAQSESQLARDQKTENGDETIVCSLVNNVVIQVEVEVKDQAGELVTGLNRGNFTVIEDGVRQEITSLFFVKEEADKDVRRF